MTGKKELTIVMQFFISSSNTFRVVVLEAGEIVEFGTPRDLLDYKRKFYEMAKDAGLV